MLDGPDAALAGRDAGRQRLHWMLDVEHWLQFGYLTSKH